MLREISNFSDNRKVEENIEKSIEERKERALKILKKYAWVLILIALAVIVIIGTNVRTKNISQLKDVTTDDWTLGPDLDPFLFLRWAKYIDENGAIMKVDYMRYVPIGYGTAGEMVLLSYMIAWFHQVAEKFTLMSIEYSAVIFPVVMFFFTTIAFFLFTRKLFINKSDKKRNIIALIATALFAVTTSLVPRTVAGIPEKESVGFLFIFLSLYLFISAFNSKSTKKAIIWAVFAAISTAFMGLTWGGGINLVFLAISIFSALAFLFNKIKKKEIIIYSIWLVGFSLFVQPFSSRYSLRGLILDPINLLAFALLGVFIVDFLLFNFSKFTKLREKIKTRIKIPDRIISIIISGIIGIIIISFIAGPGFLIEQGKAFVNSVTNPFGQDRFSLTVAENRQPFFNEWKESFGPNLFSFPIMFWLFFIGSIFLFSEMIKHLKKDNKIIMIILYIILVTGVIFSRYSQSSIMNGTSNLSLLFYFGSMVLFFIGLVYVYRKEHISGENGFEKINFEMLYYFGLFIVSIIAARGGVRLTMVLAAVVPVIIGYFCVRTYELSRESKDEIIRGVCLILFGVIALLLIYGAYQNYKSTEAIVLGSVPSSYTQQWQKAMAWVRDNTPENAVFAHWWDYGYWVQSMGNRATVLDGGNSIVYWDHLMGRHVLTGKSEEEALEFLYIHNGTHLLIDSTDIGKYSAYSSIGGDENHDRLSYFPSVVINEKATIETNDSIIYVYQNPNTQYVISSLDSDITWDYNGSEVFLPAGKSLIGAIFLYLQGEEVKKAEGVFVYQNTQYKIPLNYVYYKKLYKFEGGLNAGVFLMPSLVQTEQGTGLNEKGAGLWLSPRTADTNFVRLYLFGIQNNFRLKHSEDNFIVKDIKTKFPGMGDFVEFRGTVLGPIKIWEINYPESVKISAEKLREDYLRISYPNEALKSG